MSTEKAKDTVAKTAPTSGKAAVSKTASSPSGTGSLPAKAAIPPLFRRIDWLALLIAFAGVWITYFLTLAPELTLEDSGELCTGAFYAGIPHPPGYPFWALYSWLWTVLLPVGNVAWRVEVGEATAAAFACGLVALMVSRGSSMLMEGIEELKSLTGRWESAICLVCGSVAGLLLGMGAVMWSESVAINRISLFGVPWVMTVMVCMLRWIYAPSQRRYLFIAMFFFGICATIHQTLLVAAMGIEAAIATCQPRLGRMMFLGNTLLYLVGAFAAGLHITALLDTKMVFIIFTAVGMASFAAYVGLSIYTKETFPEFMLDGSIALALLGGFLAAKGPEGYRPFFFLLAVGGLGGWAYMGWQTRKLGHNWLIALVCGLLWFAGAMFYFYEPIAGMTNPPMEWGYPRTVEGFFHALSRGQYEKANPTDIFLDPGRWFIQLGMLAGDVAGEYNWVLALMALVPLLFLWKMRKRERTWLICLTGTYLCISVLLIILMNPSDDRASADLHKVFFTSSHAIIAILIGYGMALTAAYMATHYDRFRKWGFAGGAIAAALAIFSLLDITNFFDGITGFNGHNSPYTNPLVRWVATLANCIGSMILWVVHVIGRLFDAGYYKQFFSALHAAFLKDHYGLPTFGTLILVALPIVFLIALYVYRKRAPLAITLCLFAALPLYSAFGHWGRSEQRNHWFGYWFGHDMFTPPFKGPDGKMAYDAGLRDQAMKGPDAPLVYPEMAKDAILFGGTDPGRFCPTYMIFCESFIPHKDQPKQDQKFDRRDVYIITQNALADNTYLEYIRAQYNRSAQIDPPFFQELLRGQKEIEDNYRTNLVARMAYDVLDKPLTALGAAVERRRRAEGVYPPKEIYIPSVEDSSKCFSDYMTDAAQRFDHDQRFPNEQPQVKQGEEIHPDPETHRVSVTGQVAVMSINGLLTKVIFDHNPKNEFYVEESFPLDWMYPYLSPYGIIMKINRQPVSEMTEKDVRRDHDFWSRYSERLIGNWITYDTSVKEITDFVQKVNLRHDFSGFIGDRRFIRDDQAQKAFSKLRSSIASSIYDWRYRNSQNPVERERMLREADFAYKQAFAFCPYSPEAVYHYVTLLVNVGRIDDALMVAETCYKLDPNNEGVGGMVSNLRAMKAQRSSAQRQSDIAGMEKDIHDHPADFQVYFNLAGAYIQEQKKDDAFRVLDSLLNNSNVNVPALTTLAKVYAQLLDAGRLEKALEKMTQLDPQAVEAWDDLAAVQLALGKTNESLKTLGLCLQENAKRLKTNPKAADVLQAIRADARYEPIRSLPQYQQLAGTN